MLETRGVGLAEGDSLLERLLRVFSINCHSFSSPGTVNCHYEYGSKFNHSCHHPHVTYQAVPEQGCGRWVATRDIPEPGTILTVSYLSRQDANVATPQRRRLLYGQKGFICHCESCERVPDLFRVLKTP